WANPETLTDARGGFRLQLPPRPLADSGLRLALTGGNRVVEYGLRRTALIAGSGALGMLPLDEAVPPLPRSIVSQLGEFVRPLSESDVVDHPERFVGPAPTVTLGQGDCAMDFRAGSGVIDRYRYSMLVRLIAPELSGRRLAAGVKRDRGGT